MTKNQGKPSASEPGRGAFMALATRYQSSWSKALAGTPVSEDGFKLGLASALAETKNLEIAARENPEGCIRAVMHCAQLGLNPSPVHKHFHLIPFNSKHGWQVQAIPGYRGLLDLAMRSEEIEHIDARLVFKGEKFDYNPATGEIHHPFALDDDIDRTNDDLVIGAYAICKVAGRTQPTVMVLRRDQILARRDKGGAAKQRSASPWDTDFQAMCLKTAMRALLDSGRVPLGERVKKALQAEAEAEAAEEIKDVEAEVVATPADDELVPPMEPRRWESETPPDMAADGDVWVNTKTGDERILDGGIWVPTSKAGK